VYINRFIPINYYRLSDLKEDYKCLIQTWAEMEDTEPPKDNPIQPQGTLEESVAFPRRKNRGSLRKRPAQDDNPDDEDSTAITAARRSKEAPLAFTTKSTTNSEVNIKFESNKFIQQAGDGGATRAIELEGDAPLPASAAAAEAVEAGLYKGMAAYKDYRAGFRHEHPVDKKGAANAYGPLKGASNIRMTVRVDYQPDVCKDYKETGYCGFGDSCKFLHDRGDYKAGWQIDKEWEEKQKATRERIEAGLLQSDDDEDKVGDTRTRNQGKGTDSGVVDGDQLPFACLICRKPWNECQDPVVTKCNHYFCEQCALQHNAKTTKCAACQQPTGGIFNVARDIVKKYKSK
jgi:RING finger protein 113A